MVDQQGEQNQQDQQDENATEEEVNQDSATVETEDEEQTGTQSDVKTVEMEARKFEFDPSTVTVEQGQTLRLEVTSTDVDHGIAIPEFGVNQDLPAGETKTVEFTPDQTGEFQFVCSVYCGAGHSSMTGTLIVE